MTSQQATSESPQPSAPGSRRRWISLLFISLGISMIMVDATVVNVVLPSVVRDLSLSSTQAEWVIAIYPLVFASLLVTFGSLGDRVGRRRVFLLGAVGFVAASILVASAGSAELLIAGRFLQGIAGAAMLPTSLSLVNAIFTGRDRPIAFGIWGAVIGGMSAIGPLLGGWLTTTASWRLAFWINVPIGIALVVGTLLLVPESRNEAARRGLDVVGVLLSAIGLGAIVFALIEGQRYGWWIASEDLTLLGYTFDAGSVSAIPLFIGIGVVALAAFFYWQARQTRLGGPVLLDLTLFRIPSFAYGNVVALIVQFGEFGLIFVLPVYLVNVLNYTALQAGGVIALVALGVFIGGPSAGQLAARRGGRLVVRLGMLLEIVGMAWVALIISPTTSTWVMAPGLIVYGAGVGFATAQLTNVLLSDVPVIKSGQASGAQSTTRQVGAALGIAVLGAVLFTGIGTFVSEEVAATGTVSAAEAQAVGTAAQASAATSVPQLADSQVQQAAELGVVRAAKAAIWTAIGFVVLGLIATIRLPDDLALRRAREAAEQAEQAEPEVDAVVAGTEPSGTAAPSGAAAEASAPPRRD